MDFFPEPKRNVKDVGGDFASEEKTTSISAKANRSLRLGRQNIPEPIVCNRSVVPAEHQKGHKQDGHTIALDVAASHQGIEETTKKSIR